MSQKKACAEYEPGTCPCCYPGNMSPKAIRAARPTSKPTHTPGPWNTRIIREAFRYPDGSWAGPRSVFAIGVPEPGVNWDPEIAMAARTLCEVKEAKENDTEAAANARLIAAAPELLAIVLETAKGPSICVSRDCGTCTVCKARAAIAKAEGR